jgi:serine/threonine protein kinase
MGTVFEAVDGEGSVVAVKTLTAQLSDDEGMRRRFEAEIEALKGLRHPGIVRLLAFGEDDGQPFFAMELVRGQSLEQLLKAGRRFGWRETASIASEVARALKVAHDRGIVHRDLKPANLLFPEQPGVDGCVRLADFGIARLFGDSGHTQAGTVVGTAEYMAPEQAAGEVVDQRADLYALGLVMFAMLTGRSVGNTAPRLDDRARDSDRP